MVRFTAAMAAYSDASIALCGPVGRGVLRRTLRAPGQPSYTRRWRSDEPLADPLRSVYGLLPHPHGTLALTDAGAVWLEYDDVDEAEEAAHMRVPKTPPPPPLTAYVAGRRFHGLVDVPVRLGSVEPSGIMVLLGDRAQAVRREGSRHSVEAFFKASSPFVATARTADGGLAAVTAFGGAFVWGAHMQLPDASLREMAPWGPPPSALDATRARMRALFSAGGAVGGAALGDGRVAIAAPAGLLLWDARDSQVGFFDVPGGGVFDACSVAAGAVAVARHGAAGTEVLMWDGRAAARALPALPAPAGARVHVEELTADAQGRVLAATTHGGFRSTATGWDQACPHHCVAMTASPAGGLVLSRLAVGVTKEDVLLLRTWSWDGAAGRDGEC